MQGMSENGDWLERVIRDLQQAAEEEIAVLERKIDELLAQLGSLQERIRRASPRYAELIRPRLLPLEEIQQRLLDEETVLLSYVLGEARSFLFVVTASSLSSHELPPRHRIEELASKAYELLSHSHRPGNDVAARRTAAALSDMILAPAATQLTARRLLVVSDGALQYLPFAALPHPRDHEPLVVRHEIVYLPSASSLAALEQQLAGRTPAPKALAIVADPVFRCDDSRLREKCAELENVRYPRLPNACPNKPIWTLTC